MNSSFEHLKRAPWRKKYLSLAFNSYVQPVPIHIKPIDSKNQLKIYAERCFASCSTEAEKDKMEGLLKNMLSAFTSEELERRDWLNEPIPLISIPSDDKQEDRKKFRGENYAKPDNIRTSVVGTCQSLEKSYFRLTSEADPTTVRPEYVLVRSFAHVLSKWDDNKNAAYIIEQLKSIRQDLSIQSIKNKFAIEVYEKNCKIALSTRHFDELAQCLGQLMSLYEIFPSESKDEFICYYTLYMLYTYNISEYNVLIRKNSLKKTSISFCQFLSRAIYSKNCYDIRRACVNSPYDSALILSYIFEKFEENTRITLMKPFKSPNDEHVFASMFDVDKLMI